MKKILLISIPLFFLGLAAHAFAATNIQGFTALAPITGLTDTNALSVVNSNGLASFFNNLYKFAIGLAAAIAVIQIIWAGLEISIFQKDSVSAITDNKGKIYNAVFGLVLVLSPVLVFSIINPSILNLSLNLPPLQTTSGASVGVGNSASGGGIPIKTVTQGDCSVQQSMFLQKATCPSKEAADAFTCSDSSLTKIPDPYQCKSFDAVDRTKCLDTQIVVYCSGGTSPDLTYYYYIGLENSAASSLTLITRDQAVSNVFSTTCTNLGGKVDIGGSYFDRHNIPCTSDMNIPPVDATKYGQKGHASCITRKSSCNAPI